MGKPSVHLTMRVSLDEGRPFIESRVLPAGGDDGPIPRGKVLVVRTPILPPGASDEEVKAGVERKLVDDDDTRPLCGPECCHRGRYRLPVAEGDRELALTGPLARQTP